MGLVFGSGNHAFDNPVENLKRPRPYLLQPLSAKHSHSCLGTPRANLCQQPRLSAARHGFHKDGRCLSAAHPVYLFVKGRQLGTMTDKGGLGQGWTPIMQPHHQLQIAITVSHRLGNGLQVHQHGLGGLVTVAGILSQQPLNKFVQCERNAHPHTSNFRNRRRHLLAEDFSHAAAEEG